ncbi:MAG: hypothetical protein GY898_11840 [Proteobacteria bacterium]|nr:hypothetical protein [Pseudomonadota bacterium]
MARPSPISPRLARLLERLHRGLGRLDRGVHAAEVLNGGADLRRGPEAWDELRTEAEVCFVLSTGRTATATLAELVGTSARIAAHHEPEPRLVTMSYLAWEGHGDPAFWSEAVGLARDRAVLAAHRTGKLYFESSHRLSLLAPALADRYPRARFLLVSRRPEEFITSGVRRGFYAGHPWDHARPRPTADDPAAAQWEQWPPERRCAWLWRSINERCLEFAETLPSDRVMTLRCEDLFTREPAVIDALFRFLGAQPPSRRVVHKVLAQRRNSQVGTFPWGREPDWSSQEREHVLAELAEVTGRLGHA